MVLLNYKQQLSFFFEAVEQENTRALSRLQNMIWDVEISHRNGQILLYYAASLGKVKAIHFLISRIGVKVNTKNQATGWTALHYAMLNKDKLSQINTIYALVELGANIYTEDIYGHTPFDYATSQKLWNHHLNLKERIVDLALILGDNQLEVTKLVQVSNRALSVWMSKRKNRLPITRRSPSSEEKKNQVIQALNEGRSGKEVAKEFDVHIRIAQKWFHEYQKNNGVILHQRRFFSEEQKKQAVQQVEAGRSREDVAKELNTYGRNVGRWVQEYSTLPRDKTYTQKEKDEAVQLVRKLKNIARASNVLSIPESTLFGWVKKDDKKRGIKYDPKRLLHFNSEEKKREAIELASRLKNVKKASMILGISYFTIRHWIHKDKKKKGLPMRKRGLRFSKEEKNQAVQALNQGRDIKEVAKELGVKSATIRNWRHKSKKTKEAIDRDEILNNEILRDEVINAIKKEDDSVEEVSLDFDVPKDIVEFWLEGEGTGAL